MFFYHAYCITLEEKKRGNINSLFPFPFNSPFCLFWNFVSSKILLIRKVCSPKNCFKLVLISQFLLYLRSTCYKLQNNSRIKVTFAHCKGGYKGDVTEVINLPPALNEKKSMYNSAFFNVNTCEGPNGHIIQLQVSFFAVSRCFAFFIAFEELF